MLLKAPCLLARMTFSYNLVSLRNAVSVVLQKNISCSAAPSDNLLWGDPNATDEELLHACSIACVDEFLNRIGGWTSGAASMFPGGQKQRRVLRDALWRSQNYHF